MGFTNNNDVSKKKYRVQLKNRLSSARKRIKGQLYLIPHLFTLGNAFFGFSAVVMVASGSTVAGAYFILLGALLDALDGRIARYVGTTSEFGVQLDSLADLVSFCFAPAFLIYSTYLYRLDPFGFFIAALFFLAGMVRLARFNVIHDQQTIFFLGIPTTIAGCFLTTLLLSLQEFKMSEGILAFFALSVPLLSFLMVSRVPFPTFKNINRRLSGISVAVIIGFVIIMGLMNVLLLLCSLYFLLAFYLFVSKYVRKNRSQNQNKDGL